MQFAGIDIGGANVKLATTGGKAWQFPFPIWKNQSGLENLLKQLAGYLPQETLLGVTMTAELADCFTTKQEGVQFIVNAVSKSFPVHQPLFYRTDGVMCESNAAIEDWRMVAASNWHATAWLAFHETVEHSGFVIDIGSTTTDIIPVDCRLPVKPGQDDLDRLKNGQLFYAGAGRTPICSVLQQVQLGAETATVARELFATLADAFIWLGDTHPDESNSDTADGRPATRANAGQRLARMICSDIDDLKPGDIDAIARQTKESLVGLLSTSLARVIAANPKLPLLFKSFGGGSWLVNDIVSTTLKGPSLSKSSIVPFSNNETTNQAAPALAVATKRQQVFLQRSAIG